MVQCCVYKCTNKTDQHNKPEELSFHYFPKNTRLKKLWCNSIGRADFKPTIHSVVCSVHFKNTDRIKNLRYDMLKDQYKIRQPMYHLKKDSVPCLKMGRTLRTVISRKRKSVVGKLNESRSKLESSICFEMPSQPTTSRVDISTSGGDNANFEDYSLESDVSEGKFYNHS